jgi:hypothetical protein
MKPRFRNPLPAETLLHEGGAKPGEAKHLVAQGKSIGVSEVTGDGEERVVGVLEPEAGSQDPSEVKPVGRHRKSATHEPSAQSPTGHVKGASETVHGSEMVRQIEDLPEDPTGVQVDLDSPPCHVRHDLDRKLERRAPEVGKKHLGIHVTPKGEETVWPAVLHEIQERPYTLHLGWGGEE